MTLSVLTFLGVILYATATHVLNPPKVDVEVQYLTNGISNYVGVECNWKGPSDVTIDKLEIFGDDGDTDGIVAYLDSSGPVFNLPNTPIQDISGNIKCKNSECKANIDLKWKPYPITWADPSFKKFGCRVRGVRGGAPVVVEKAYNYRVREETENEVIDGRVTSDFVHFKLRGGLAGEGAIRYFFMRCSANADIEFPVTSLGIYKANGTLIKGISTTGDLDNVEENNIRVQSSLNCEEDGARCNLREKAFIWVLWKNIDIQQDLGTTDDIYRLYCKVRSEKGLDAVTYSQYRTVRIHGGRQDI